MSFPINFIAASREFSSKIKEDPTIKSVPAPYFRKSFNLNETPSELKLLITTTGFYELYINGNKITKSLLAPYISNPDDLLFYDNYNISPFVKKGVNVIALWLGNGFGNTSAGYVWEFTEARFRCAPSVALGIYDGNKIILETDSTFKTHPSPLYFDDYRAGEYYDAQKIINNWAEIDFDDSNWQNAISVIPPRGECAINTALPIVVTKEVKPLSFFKKGDGYIFDFGANMAGVCRLKIKGERGQVLTIHHGELLLPDGDLNTRNVAFNAENFVQKSIFICSGGNDEWTPSFSYNGFRYVRIKGANEGQLSLDTLTFIVFNTQLSERGGFTCSDKTINLLQEFTRRSTLSNFHHIPTDCPQREKNGWTADAALSAEHMLLNLSPEVNYSQWLRCIRKAQRDDGALPGIVPTTGWGFKWGNGPAWDCVIAYIPYFTYIYRGDKQILKENTHSILRYLEYISTRIRDDGLIAIGLGDWCPPGRENESYKSPLCFTDTVITMDICEKAKFIFDTLNMPLHSNFADSLYKKLYSSAREHLIDKNNLIALGDNQTSQAMAIFYNLFSDEEKNTAFARLIDIIHRDGDFMDTGVLGARVIFHVLSEYGESELAYKMITRPDFPSYGWWIEKGATTLWEEFRTDKTASLNHHFWGDISHWFIRWLAGIHYNPDRQGNSLNIRPQFVSQLNFCEGFHMAPQGEIRVKWYRNCKNIVLCVSVPEGLNGNIVLPKGYAFEDSTHIKCLNSESFEIFPEKQAHI